MKLYFTVLGILALLTGIGFIAVLLYQKWLQASAGTVVISRKKDKFHFVYKAFSEIPLLRRVFLKVRKRVEILYPADAMSINKKTTQILMRGVVIMVLGIIAAMVLGSGNIFYTCAILMVTFVWVDGSIEGAATALEILILEQFVRYLDGVTHQYHKSKIVENSIYRAMDNQPYEIRMHIQNIYNIITLPTSKMKQKISEYVGREPSAHFLTFLSAASSTKEFGVKTLEDGTPAFLNDLHVLKDDVRSELLQKRKSKTKFKGMATLCLVIILIVKPAEYALSHMVVELAPYYTGLYGIVSVVAVFVISVVCYEIILILRDNGAGREKTKEDSYWCKLTSLPIVSPLLTAIEYKNYTKYMKINENLRAAGDHTGPKAFILKKFVFCAVAFFSVILVMEVSTITDRHNQITEFANDFTDSVVPSADYTNSMEDAAKTYTQSLRKMDIENLTQEDLTAAIMNDTDIHKQTYAEQVANLVIKRLNEYNNTYFRWYYLLIAMLCSVAAYFTPDLFLNFRKQAIAQRKEAEVLQFQSLILILMHMNGTTLSVILEWIERLSYCFKASIGECRVNLSKGPTAALERMKEQESDCQSFCHFVDNLLDIDNAGVERAFAELQSDRKFAEKEREVAFEESLENRSSTANIVSLVPFFTTVILFVIVPTVLYAFGMYTQLSQF